MKKMRTVPYSVLSADREIERMRELLTSGRDLEIDADGTISAIGASAASNREEKAKTVPKTVVSANSVAELINEMRGNTGAGNRTAADNREDNVTNGDLETTSGGRESKKGVVPKSVLSAPQWYETKKELFEAEVMAMYEFKPEARYFFTQDGRMYWHVRCSPKVAGRRTRMYDIALIYDSDHPQVRYGSSVKAYLLRPSIHELQQIVNRIPSVSPKVIPHTLTDSNGERYLCSSDVRDVSDSLGRGVTSAATSLRFALRWINIFELGLMDPKVWGKFQRHGEI